VLGHPETLAKKYANEGIDEIVYMDTVASLYGRNNLYEMVERATGEVFVPVAVGGGIKSLSDIQKMLRSGADKVIINTAAIKNPEIINKGAKTFGSQCIVINIEARKQNGNWEALTDNGRERTGKDVIEWAKEVVDRGAGEIIVTSVDRDGTGKGFDIELIEQLNDLPVPIVAHGGAGCKEHFLEIAKYVDAICVASVFHYHYLEPPKGDFKEGVLDFINGKRGDNKPKWIHPISIGEVKQYLIEKGVDCRVV
jgi:cyclase